MPHTGIRIKSTGRELKKARIIVIIINARQPVAIRNFALP